MPPKRLGNIVSQLLSRRGYASVTADEQLAGTIASVLGPSMAGSVQVGKISRGTLMLLAGDSTAMQELSFAKRALVKRIQADHPAAKITDVRFKVSVHG